MQTPTGQFKFSF